MKILVSACLLGLPCRYDGRSVPNDAVIALGKEHVLVPFCPEIYGGLATPREPAEIQNDRIVTRSGADVTEAYRKGADEALRVARLLGCSCAVLQDRSPSCGSGVRYDGTFTGTLTDGDGLTASLLKENHIQVIRASQVSQTFLCCPCSAKCHRHGRCDECRSHHAGRKNPPFCERC